jgi:hypothetical protein
MTLSRKEPPSRRRIREGGVFESSVAGTGARVYKGTRGFAVGVIHSGAPGEPTVAVMSRFDAAKESASGNAQLCGSGHVPRHCGRGSDGVIGVIRRQCQRQRQRPTLKHSPNFAPTFACRLTRSPMSVLRFAKAAAARRGRPATRRSCGDRNAATACASAGASSAEAHPRAPHNAPVAAPVRERDAGLHRRRQPHRRQGGGGDPVISLARRHPDQKGSPYAGDPRRGPRPAPPVA